MSNFKLLTLSFYWLGISNIDLSWSPLTLIIKAANTPCYSEKGSGGKEKTTVKVRNAFLFKLKKGKPTIQQKLFLRPGWTLIW